MMLSELRSLVRLTLADETQWPDATLDAWIGAAIRLYSAQFPRTWRHALELEFGTQAYPLPGAHGFQGIVSVEYPAGQDPPVFLAQVPRWADEFGEGEDVYALMGAFDDTEPDEDVAAGYVVFGPRVSDGEGAIITYLGCHAGPEEGGDGEDDVLITVPRGHLEAITAYCEFAAHYQLETGEAAAIAESTVVLSELGDQARRAWIRYKEVMDRLSWLGAPAPPVQGYARWGDIGL